MADKKYYWLKLPTDFFTKPSTIILLGKGDDKISIYIQMLTIAVNTSCKLMYTASTPYTVETLAMLLRRSNEDMQNVIDILIELELLEVLDDGTFYLTELQNMIGSESTSAERQRRSRQERDKCVTSRNSERDSSVTSCDTSVTNCDNSAQCHIENRDIEKENRDLKNIHGHLPMTTYVESEGIVSQENTEEAGTDNVPEGTVMHSDGSTESEQVPKSRPAYPKSFEEFWSAYPRRIGKGEAYKKYKARLNDGFSEQELITAAINYAQICKSEHTPDNYIKHPKTFLSDSTPFMDYVPKQAETARDEPKICNDDNPYAEWSRPKEDKP
nr:MAG TPA: Replication initiation and membrane attachment [Caudoviricetes sp.]